MSLFKDLVKEQKNEKKQGTIEKKDKEVEES